MEKRREIIVPKNKEAEFALDYDEATVEQLDILFLNHAYYRDFWQSGLLEFLNATSPDSLIADYEVAVIAQPAVIEKILAALKNKEGFSYALAPQLTDELIKYFELALERQTSVYFYL
jgi:hypothetical protein